MEAFIGLMVLFVAFSIAVFAENYQAAAVLGVAVVCALPPAAIEFYRKGR